MKPFISLFRTLPEPLNTPDGGMRLSNQGRLFLGAKDISINASHGKEQNQLSQKADSGRSGSVSFPPPADGLFCGDSPVWPRHKAWRPVRTGQSIWLPTLRLLHVGQWLGRNTHVPGNGTKVYKLCSTAIRSKGQMFQMFRNLWPGLIYISQPWKPTLRAKALEAWDLPPIRVRIIANGTRGCWALDIVQIKR